ncbi:MAG: L-alanine exporter AlaE [Nanoarchaeota archaeon]
MNGEMPVSGLEDRLTTAKPRNAIPDTISAVTFSVGVMGAIELLSGLSIGQVVRSRAFMGTVNLIAGAPYGAYRDYVIEKGGATEPGNRLRKAACDMAASASFYGVIYLGNLLMNCDNTDQVARSWAYGIGLGTVIGVPFGYYMEWMRKWYGAGPDEARNPTIGATTQSTG